MNSYINLHIYPSYGNYIGATCFSNLYTQFNTGYKIS